MTSLELFRKGGTDACGYKEAKPCDWGTGRPAVSAFDPPPLDIKFRTPTWMVTGRPLAQNYQGTALSLSKVRNNDELVPRPEAVNVQEHAITAPFPSEHPYSSHIQRFAMLPSFASPGDPDRGLDAMARRPCGSELPANPNPTRVVQKPKGGPWRREAVCLPTEAAKQPLRWTDGTEIQSQRVAGQRPRLYPAPPSLTCPNPQERPPELQQDPRSANVLRNLERAHWITSNKLDYTGLGPANPMNLDNLDCKQLKLLDTKTYDHNLYPCSLNTFDPARPMQGRLRKLFAPKPVAQTLVEDGLAAPAPPPGKLTLSQREEKRLLHGTDHANLPPANPPCVPAPPAAAPRIEGQAPGEAPGPVDQVVVEMKSANRGRNVHYLKEMAEAKHRANQGMEAEARWRGLEAATPSHQVAQLKQRQQMQTKKEQPSTFYKHESKYNAERAGLYKTSYDPAKLAGALNRDTEASAFDTSKSHDDAALYPTHMWDETMVGLDASQTARHHPGHLAGDTPNAHHVLQPHRQKIAQQKASLQPTAMSAPARVQEAAHVTTDSTVGQHHNTKLFLQEHTIDPQLRREPENIMSRQNQNLERTREHAQPRIEPNAECKSKKVSFGDHVDVNNFYENMPVRVTEPLQTPLTCQETAELATGDGAGGVGAPSIPESMGVVLVGDARALAENLGPPPRTPTILTRDRTPTYRKQEYSFKRLRDLRPKPLSETHEEFRGFKTVMAPVGLDKMCGTPAPRPPSMFTALDLTEKKDPRFLWEPECGKPRPQSCLMEMQDNFIKSQLHKQFHALYGEGQAVVAPAGAGAGAGGGKGRKLTMLSPITIMNLPPAECKLII